MLLKRRRNRRAFPYRVRDAQDDLAQCRVLFLLAQTRERLRDGNTRAQQSGNLSCEGGDFLPPHARPKSEFRNFPIRFRHGQSRRGRAVPIPVRGYHLQVGWEKPPLAQRQQSCPAILGFDDPLDRITGLPYGLVPKRGHSMPSPETTLTISS